MKWLIPSILASIYSLFLTLSIGVIPYHWIITRTHVKATLHDSAIYTHMVTIAQDQWRQLTARTSVTSSTLFEQLILDHVDEILTQDWVREQTDLVIDTAFDSLENQQAFPDLDITIAPLKQNLLTLLAKTPIAKEIPKFAGTLPETVRLSVLLQQDVNLISHYLQLAHLYLQSLFWLEFAALCMSALTLLMLLLLVPTPQVWIWSSHLVAGGIWLMVAFITWFGMLSSYSLAQLTKASLSAWEVLGWTMLLNLARSVLEIWAWVGLGSLTLGTFGLLWHLLRK